MNISKTIQETRQAVSSARGAGRRIGFVATMGAFHEGHLSLIRTCRSQCDFTVVSIFVNPTQFGPSEDFAQYPRDFESDCDDCLKEGVELVFMPSDYEMYPEKNISWVNVETLTDHLCGKSRPIHFRGVCTVVAKLFGIVRPDVSYFGQKDAQQVAVIERMVRDLNLDIEISRCPTVREADGLAMSSRNQYLSESERQDALCLWQAMQRASEMATAGEDDCEVIIAQMRKIVEKCPSARIDYISIVDNELLQPLSRIDRQVLVALAVKIGKCRLIDNIVVDRSAS
ncbi:MAG: pantoate--beta-alanine ligase [Planctomycetes bacterium]|nr:pantoate--beta-alanine ligase [Planctomycetota bacterium]